MLAKQNRLWAHRKLSCKIRHTEENDAKLKDKTLRRNKGKVDKNLWWRGSDVDHLTFRAGWIAWFGGKKIIDDFFR